MVFLCEGTQRESCWELPSPPGLCHPHTGCPLPRTPPSTGTNRAGEDTPPASHRHSRAESPKPRGAAGGEGLAGVGCGIPVPSRAGSGGRRTGLGTIPAKGHHGACPCPALPAGSGGDPGSSREHDSVWPPLLAARVAHLSSFSSRLWDNWGKRGENNPPSAWLQPSQLIPAAVPSPSPFSLFHSGFGEGQPACSAPLQSVRARGKDVVRNELLLPPQRILQKTIHTLHQLPPPAPS